jgi:hypothetical protein
MPWEDYIGLAGQNLESLESEYRAAAPVFLVFSCEGSLKDWPKAVEGAAVSEAEEIEAGSEGHQILEMRHQKTAYWCLGMLGLQSAARQVHGIWTVLSLAFPQLFLPDPGLSQVFIKIEGEGIDTSSLASTMACVQGPADHEYLFLDTSTQPVLAGDDYKTLDKVFAVIQTLYGKSFPDGVLESFLESQSPLLGSSERSTLCVMALEALVMSDVSTSVTKIFAQRLANLCPDVNSKLARSLYATRSDHLHGIEAEDPGPLAPSILAQSICKMGELLESGQTLEAIQERLDDSSAVSQAKPPIRPSPPIKQGPAVNRIAVGERTTFVVLTSGPTLAAEEGQAACWCPLARIEARVWVPFGKTDPGILIAPLNGSEVLSLEEKESRAEYASQLNLIEERVAGFFLPIAGVGPGSRPLDIGDSSRIEEVMKRAARVRDFGTIALRLGGFDDFWDPEWHGLAMFVGKARVRQATIYRQSVLAEIYRSVVVADHDQVRLSEVGEKDLDNLSGQWDLLFEFLDDCRPQIERSLVLYRRACDPSFLPDSVRTRLAFAALESMLGRFADHPPTQRLEDLVARVVGDQEPDAMAWFLKAGRRKRNEAAHTLTQSSNLGSDLSHLLRILRIVTPAYLKASVERQDRNPSQEFVEWIKTSNLNLGATGSASRT